MTIPGLLTKMITEYANPIQYYLNFDDEIISVNQLLEKKIKIEFSHYQCLGCGQDLEIFAMGYCKNCYFNLAQAGDWIVRPELSKAHLDIEDRNIEIEKQAQLQPHIVYLANSGGIKVGVTRKSQVPTRWIDQGAEFALKIAETENRYEAGMIEVALKSQISDKTNYRKMLINNVELLDLSNVKNSLFDFIPKEYQHFVTEDNQMFQIHYPVLKYPSKIKSINLKKIPEFEGVLIGIKGQYLLFENNLVFNVRSHEGFVINLNIS
ncbi:DUF2797 domain-containing protein [Apibacter sp. HY039]|uniref:DUF2797 domain-containing protein n=1 Tax=Apibacter sp. HY039 TaxID=2501476 RepID=UPI000FEB823D|nr:DUF2797 domain-containing protein [Apibacter sp. HY039]